jgi:hypothetical protein
LSQYLRRRSNVMLDDGLVSNREVRIGGETYDVRAVGSRGTILLPVKTRETMGGGHALLFTRDIFKAISVAKENRYGCLPVSLRSHGRAIWTPSLESTTSGFKPTPTR